MLVLLTFHPKSKCNHIIGTYIHHNKVISKIKFDTLESPIAESYPLEMIIKSGLN